MASHKKQVKRLKKDAQRLWDDQQALLTRANSVARDAWPHAQHFAKGTIDQGRAGCAHRGRRPSPPSRRRPPRGEGRRALRGLHDEGRADRHAASPRCRARRPPRSPSRRRPATVSASATPTSRSRARRPPRSSAASRSPATGPRRRRARSSRAPARPPRSLPARLEAHRGATGRKKGLGVGGVLDPARRRLLAGIGYAVWQTLRADDDLWVADEDRPELTTTVRGPGPRTASEPRAVSGRRPPPAPSRSATTAGRAAPEIRAAVKISRAGSPVGGDGPARIRSPRPDEVRQQRDRVARLDEPHVHLQVRRLVAHVRFEAREPALLLRPVPGGRATRLDHPGGVRRVGEGCDAESAGTARRMGSRTSGRRSSPSCHAVACPGYCSATTRSKSRVAVRCSAASGSCCTISTRTCGCIRAISVRVSRQQGEGRGLEDREPHGAGHAHGARGDLRLARSRSASTSPARSASVCASGVSTPAGRRDEQGTPTSRSRIASCWDTEDGLNRSAAATSASVPRSASSFSSRSRRTSYIAVPFGQAEQYW